MNTLFDKIWDAHVVTTVEDGPTQLYIDRLYCHAINRTDCLSPSSSKRAITLS